MWNYKQWFTKCSYFYTVCFICFYLIIVELLLVPTSFNYSLYILLAFLNHCCWCVGKIHLNALKKKFCFCLCSHSGIMWEASGSVIFPFKYKFNQCWALNGRSRCLWFWSLIESVVFGAYCCTFVSTAKFCCFTLLSHNTCKCFSNVFWCPQSNSSMNSVLSVKGIVCLGSYYEDEFSSPRDWWYINQTSLHNTTANVKKLIKNGGHPCGSYSVAGVQLD